MAQNGCKGCLRAAEFSQGILCSCLNFDSTVAGFVTKIALNSILDDCCGIDLLETSECFMCTDQIRQDPLRQAKGSVSGSVKQQRLPPFKSSDFTFEGCQVNMTRKTGTDWTAI